MKIFDEQAAGGGEGRGGAKFGYFLLEGINAFATTYYVFYLFFFMAKRFGFGNLENLALSALNGFVYIFAAWFGGRFAQRFGYFEALGVGFGTMAGALGIGLMTDSVGGQVGVMVIWTLGVCFTWPTLEALVSEKEDPEGLQRMIGIYNLVWAGVGAVAYFLGGALLEQFGLRSLFWIPIGLHAAQLVILGWMARARRAGGRAALGAGSAGRVEVPRSMNPRPIAVARRFVRMAWVANPFAYVAINTVVAVAPGVARALDLSPKLAGFFCSIWLFARMAAFFALWRWTGWHYRASWFFCAYALLIGSFCFIVLAPALWIVVAAQVVFGGALGLIYYSSLYYSMDTGDAKGEQGGAHEAAIGAGIFAGPAAGAAALHFFPNYAQSGTVAVGGLLALGLVILLMTRRRG